MLALPNPRLYRGISEQPVTKLCTPVSPAATSERKPTNQIAAVTRPANQSLGTGQG